MRRTHIPLLGAFAIAMAALTLAAATAATECDGGGSCDTRLALSIIALGPACLVALVALIGLRTEARGPAVQTLTAIGLGVALAPLAAFIIRDLWTLLEMSALFAALVALVLLDVEDASRARATEERDETEERTSAPPEPAPTPDDMVARRMDRIVAMARSLDAASLELTLRHAELRRSGEALRAAMRSLGGGDARSGVIDLNDVRQRLGMQERRS